MGRTMRLARTVALVAVLAVSAFVVPTSAVQPTEVSLVKIRHAQGVATGGEDVVWILGVGSDARPGQAMTRARGDALQLVGINTRTGAATAIGVPRDSWVAIPGYGNERVNAALFFGGPQLLGRTVVGAVNLGRKRIAGFTSEFLVLGALDPDGTVRLLQLEDGVEPGAPIA